MIIFLNHESHERLLPYSLSKREWMLLSPNSGLSTNWTAGQSILNVTTSFLWCYVSYFKINATSCFAMADLILSDFQQFNIRKLNLFLASNLTKELSLTFSKRDICIFKIIHGFKLEHIQKRFWVEFGIWASTGWMKFFMKSG